MEPKDKKKTYNPAHYTEEARQDRFVRVAERRTNQIIECIRRLGNTSNKSLYKYEAHDVDKIFETIEKKLIATRARFKTAAKEAPFKLKD